MKIQKLLTAIAVIISIIFITSCGEDTTNPTPNDEYPDVSVTGPGVSVSAQLGDTIYYTVKATKGDYDLKTLSFTVDGETVTGDRLQYIIVDGQIPASNPILLIGEESGFTKEIGFIVRYEDMDYQIIITDDNNRTVTSNFSIQAEATAPTLSTSMMSGSRQVEPGSLVAYPLTGVVGDFRLSTLEVIEDGELVSADRIYFNGPQQTDNPFAIEESLKDGFESIHLELRADDEITTHSYEIVLTDEQGLTSRLQNLSITTLNPVNSFMGVLFNQGGPQGTGGLDLDNGDGTGSMDPDADIRDMGIDGDGNWLKQLGSVNGSVIKRIIPGQDGISEGFAFSDVVGKSQLEEIFNLGVDYQGEVVSVGDLYSVSRDNNYYLLHIAEVNETSNDNADNYVVDIKN